MTTTACHCIKSAGHPNAGRGPDEDKKFVNCHISFLKFEYFTQRRGEAEYAEVFATQILIITLRSLYLCVRNTHFRYFL